MRVGLTQTPSVNPVIKSMWDIIESELQHDEPVVYVPFTTWCDNCSFYDPLEQGIIDMFHVPYVTDGTNDVNFSVTLYQSSVILIYPRPEKFAVGTAWLSPDAVLSIFPEQVWLAFSGLICLLTLVSSQRSIFGKALSAWKWFEHLLGQNTSSSTTAGLRSILLVTGVLSLHFLSLYQDLFTWGGANV